MPWVVDSCVLLDLATDDAQFGLRSLKMLENHQADGLVACPISVVEIVPQFGGDLAKVRFFLDQSGIASNSPWLMSDTEAAAKGWQAYVTAKRLGNVAQKRPVADILIGGFAMRHRGLITRNISHFRPYFPELTYLGP